MLIWDFLKEKGLTLDFKFLKDYKPTTTRDLDLPIAKKLSFSILQDFEKCLPNSGVLLSEPFL